LTCPLCGSSEGEVVFVKDGYPLLKCGCGVMYWDYGETEPPSESGVQGYMRQHQLGLHEKIRDHVPRGKVLDYGGGTGCYTAPLKEHGYEVYLLDPDREAVGYGVKVFGVEGYVGYGAGSPWIDGFFDLVVMNQVIEHFIDPLLELMVCHMLLKQGGVLYLRTGATWANPDFGYDWEYARPEERTFWSLPLLKRIAEEAGFNVLKMDIDEINGYNLEIWVRK